MRKDKNFMLCTVKELALYIMDKIYIGNDCYQLAENFPNCDFSIVDTETYGKKLFGESFTRALLSAGDWYGIKAVDTGFNSLDLTLICDYYGGGAAHIAALYFGLEKDCAMDYILSAIKNTLSVKEYCISDSTLLIVNFL